jgi:hypothetical protein
MVTHQYVGLTNYEVQIYKQTVLFTYSFGDLVSGLFVPDPALGPAITVLANLATNPPTWSASDGFGFATGGTLTVGPQTAPITATIASAVAAEPTIAGFIAAGLLPGTVVAG